MEDKGVDRFEANDNPFMLSSDNITENFFLQEEASLTQLTKGITEPTRRLNDYDYNLLQEDAYKDVKDELFKLEYKISKIEDEIKKVNSQIQASKDIKDYNSTETLQNRKISLENEYRDLLYYYNERSISTKISDKLANFIWGKKGDFKSSNDVVEKILEKIFLILPKKVISIFELRKTLSKLSNINKSVDELVTMNIPFGENFDRYDRLSKYIIKANAIQNSITKTIGRK